VLHDAEHCLRFDSTKAAQGGGAAATSIRSGLQAPHRLVWNGTEWEDRALADGCDELLIQAKLATTALLSTLNRLALERFVALCCGEVRGTNWQRPDKLPAFELGVDEGLRRIGFCRDPESLVAAAQRLGRMAALLAIFENPTVPLEQFSKLLLKSEFAFTQQERGYNLYKDGKPFGVGAYVGDDTNGVLAEQAKDSLRGIFAESGRVPIFVWYREAGNLQFTSSLLNTSIVKGPETGNEIV
jgi:hypothetical protein